jgi:tetratricopeptide (TPR) repeat protein
MSRRQRWLHWGAPFASIALLFVGTVAAQTVAEPTPQGDELRSRLAAAGVAQQSGDAAAVAEANRRVVALALRQMAELRSSEGQVAVAAELCRRSLALEDSPETRLRLAIVYTQASQTDDALREVAKVSAANPQSAAPWNLAGKLWMMKKDYRKAADALDKSLARQPDMEVAYTMATALLKLKENQKAAAVFQKMYEASGDNAGLHVLTGRAYQDAELNEDAEREYKAAIAKDAKGSRGHYFLGLFYLEKNGWAPTPQVREEFLTEVGLNPADFFGNYFLGYLSSEAKEYAESDRYLKVAATAKPEWPEPYLYMGLNAYGVGANRQAEEYLRKAIELTGKDEDRNNFQIRRAYFTLGRILMVSGRREEGAKLLARSREMETSLVVNSRPQALATKDAAPGSDSSDADRATDKTRPVMRLAGVTNPAAPMDAATWESAHLSSDARTQSETVEKQLRTILSSAYNDWGASEARRREYASALEHFQDAERWDSKTPGLMRNIGLAAFLSKKYEESARALRVVLAEDPADQRAASMLAMSLYSTKNYAEAVKAFERVGDTTALADPRMAYSWAVSLAKTKDSQQAATVLGKLVAQQLPPEILVLAGQLYADLGDRANAQNCYRRAKEQDPNIELPR